MSLPANDILKEALLDNTIVQFFKATSAVFRDHLYFMVLRFIWYIYHHGLYKIIFVMVGISTHFIVRIWEESRYDIPNFSSYYISWSS